MDRAGFLKHWEKIKRNYPSWFRSNDCDGLADDYFEALKDFADGVVFLAVKNHLEGDRADKFPRIGTMISLCRSFSTSEGQQKGFQPDPLPDNHSPHERKLYEMECFCKDRWVRTRILYLTVVAGGPCLSRDEAVRKALTEWSSKRHKLIPCDPPDEVKEILERFNNGRKQAAEGERSNQGIQRAQTEGDSADQLAEPLWMFEEPACVDHREQPVSPQNASGVDGCPW